MTASGPEAARAVVDPGVFFSALLSARGAPRRLVRALAAGAFASVASPALLGELARVLGRPKFATLPAEDRAALVDLVGARSVLVDDPPPHPGLAPDPGDDYLVALALAAGATHLVTGDRTLLGAARPGFSAVTPRRFVDEVLGGGTG